MRNTRLMQMWLPVLAGVAAGAAVIYVAFNYLYGSVIGLFGVAGPVGALFIYGNGTAVGLCVWIIARGLVRGRWRKLSIVCMVAYYIASFVGIVLFKSPGIREVNLSVQDIVVQATSAPAALWANILLFVPLGAMLAARLRGFWPSIGAAAVISLFVEVTQFMASLGIADVVDFVCNMIGAMAGVIGWLLFQRRFVLSVSESGKWLLLVPKEAPDDKRARGVGFMVLCGVQVGLLAALAAVTVFGGTGGSCATTFPSIEDPIMQALPQEVATSGSQLLSKASVGDMESIDLLAGSLEGNQLILEGAAVVQCEIWKDENGDLRLGLLAYLSEECDGITVGHGFPAVALSSSRLLDDGGDTLSLEELLTRYEGGGPFKADLKISLMKGWMRVDELTVKERADLDPLDPVPFVSWNDYSSLCLAPKCRERWLILDKTNESHMWGYIMGTAEFQEEGVWFATCAVKDDLRGCPVVHMVNVDIDSTPQEWGSPSDPVELTIRYVPSGLGDHHLALVR